MWREERRRGDREGREEEREGKRERDRLAGQTFIRK